MQARSHKRKIGKALAGGLLLFAFASGCSVETKQTAKMIEDQIENAADSDNPYVLAVKGGYPEDRPDQLYGDAFEAFFASPTWTYFMSDTGEHVVEFTGTMMYMDTEVKARIQFIVDDETDTFEVGALSFNEVPQTELIKLSVLAKVFEEGDAAAGEQSGTEEPVQEIADDASKEPESEGEPSGGQTAEGDNGLYTGMLENIPLALGDSTELIEEQYGQPDAVDYYEGGLYFSYPEVVFLTSAAFAEDGSIEHGKIISIALPAGAAIGGVTVGDTFDQIESVMGAGERYEDEYDGGWSLSYAFGDYVVTFTAPEETGQTTSMEYHHVQYAIPYS